MDRITGEITPDLPPNLVNFYELYLRGQTTGPEWFVADDHIRLTTGAPGPNGVVRIYEQWLSDPYTLGMLQADMDALIDAVNPDTIPWGKLKTIARFVDTPDGRILAEMSAVGPEPQIYIPSSLVYDVFARSDGGLWDVPELKAAAWYIYVPSFWKTLAEHGQYPVTPPPPSGSTYVEPSWYIKLVGFFSLKGKFCEKSQFIDYLQGANNREECESRQGSCGTYFKVQPPDLVVGNNGYKTITPNCECQ